MHCNRFGPRNANIEAGFTYIELLVSLLIGSLLLLGISNALSTGINSIEPVQQKNALNREARFAMQRIQQAVSHSPRILLPLGDFWFTGRKENERDVLAVTLAHHIDSDGDGVADADNDGDGLFDEDLPANSNNDAAAGIYAIDDDGDGFVDEGANANDDESDGVLGLFADNEDPINGIDDDDDGSIDEDPPADMNDDGDAGIRDVDDDGDGTIDEGPRGDDDEDGLSNEDWYDAVVFYMSGSDLIERTPVPWDENESGTLDGRDFIEQVIATDVSVFHVVREPMTDERAELVTILLQLGTAAGESLQLTTQVRVGGGL